MSSASFIKCFQIHRCLRNIINVVLFCDGRPSTSTSFTQKYTANIEFDVIRRSNLMILNRSDRQRRDGRVKWHAGRNAVVGGWQLATHGRHSGARRAPGDRCSGTRRRRPRRTSRPRSTGRASCTGRRSDLRGGR